MSDTIPAFRSIPEGLDAVRQLAADRADIEWGIQRAVKLLRTQRVPWSKIGEALGVTAQAAQQRYSQSN